MKHGIHRQVAAALLLAIGAVPVAATAVSYYPLYHLQESAETAATTNQTVYLFFSGTAEERRVIQEGDLLTVSRIGRTCEAAVVGRIRVLALIGETYLKAVVLEGSITVGDIARKGAVSCLVIPAEPCQR